MIYLVDLKKNHFCRPFIFLILKKILKKLYEPPQNRENVKTTVSELFYIHQIISSQYIHHHHYLHYNLNLYYQNLHLDLFLHQIFHH